MLLLLIHQRDKLAKSLFRTLKLKEFIFHLSLFSTSSVPSIKFIVSKSFWSLVFIWSNNLFRRIRGDLNPVKRDILASITFILALSLIIDCSSVHWVVFVFKTLRSLGVNIDEGRGALVFFLFLKQVGLAILNVSSDILVGLFTFRSLPFKNGRLGFF